MRKQQQPLPIELDDKAAEGIYSNFVLSTFTASEFVIDFARLLPGNKKAKVFSRIVMTPQSAKSLYHLLGNTIGNFEKQFGEITLPRKNARQGTQNIGFPTGYPGDVEKDPSKEN